MCHLGLPHKPAHLLQGKWKRRWWKENLIPGKLSHCFSLHQDLWGMVLEKGQAACQNQGTVYSGTCALLMGCLGWPHWGCGPSDTQCCGGLGLWGGPLRLRRRTRRRFYPWVGKIFWRRAWHPTPVFLPGESHGLRSLKGYSPQGHTESDTTKVTQHLAQGWGLQ